MICQQSDYQKHSKILLYYADMKLEILSNFIFCASTDKYEIVWPCGKTHYETNKTPIWIEINMQFFSAGDILFYFHSTAV